MSSYASVASSHIKMGALKPRNVVCENYKFVWQTKKQNFLNALPDCKNCLFCIAKLKTSSASLRATTLSTSSR